MIKIIFYYIRLKQVMGQVIGVTMMDGVTTMDGQAITSTLKQVGISPSPPFPLPSPVLTKISSKEAILFVPISRR